MVPLSPRSALSIDGNWLENRSGSDYSVVEMRRVMSDENESALQCTGAITRLWPHWLRVCVFLFLVCVFLQACDLVKKKYSIQHIDCALPHSLIPLRAALVSCQHSERQQDELDAPLTAQPDPRLFTGKKNKHLGFSLNLSLCVCLALMCKTVLIGRCRGPCFDANLKVCCYFGVLKTYVFAESTTAKVK